MTSVTFPKEPCPRILSKISSLGLSIQIVSSGSDSSFFVDVSSVLVFGFLLNGKPELDFWSFLLIFLGHCNNTTVRTQEILTSLSMILVKGSLFLINRATILVSFHYFISVSFSSLLIHTISRSELHQN